MFNNKKALVKLTAGIGLSTALLLGENVTNNVFPSSTVEAASSYKVVLKHNAYVYNYKGKRIKSSLGKYFIKKGTSMSYVGTKKIKGKKYYNLGHGEYIKAGNVEGSSSSIKPLSNFNKPT